MEEQDELINQLMNDEGVCTTAPATLGLLISWLIHQGVSNHLDISSENKSKLKSACADKSQHFYENQ